VFDDTTELFSFPAVGRKKLTAAFDGGRITSDGGVMLLAAAERRIGIAGRLAGLIADRRHPALITHGVADILRARVLAIACGDEDANDLDHLRPDPGFKLACGQLPDSGRDLCTQPTMSRWENAPTLREVVRLTYAMIDLYQDAEIRFSTDGKARTIHRSCARRFERVARSPFAILFRLPFRSRGRISARCYCASSRNSTDSSNRGSTTMSAPPRRPGSSRELGTVE